MKLMFTVCLSHDIDRPYKSFQYIVHFVKSLARGDLKKGLYHLFSVFGKHNPYFNFDFLAEIEKSYGVRSTYFFMNETGKARLFAPRTWEIFIGRYSFDDPAIQNVIRTIDRSGCEIGLHGSYYSYNNKTLLQKEKDQLESIIGHPVTGTRQHYLNRDENTWKMQEEIGFNYDSSLEFSRSFDYFDDARLRPFYPHQSRFVVFPLHVMDTSLMLAARDFEAMWEKCREIIDKVENEKTILVVNFHIRFLNTRERPDIVKLYKTIIEECRKRGAQFITMSEAYSNFLDTSVTELKNRTFE
jgi:peptidoglycan/xylan/chitin deacetylase (PgdA/CDA1 family)